MYSPNFTITNKILKNIGIIEACREVIVNAPLVPAWEAKFRREAQVRSVHFSTHLEGNELSYTAVEESFEGKDVVGKEKDIQEIINYRRVLDFIKNYAADHKQEYVSSGRLPVTEEVILKLHQITSEKILPVEEAGRYRRDQVVLKNSLTGEISFRPPPALEVPYLSEDLINWIRKVSEDEIHPVLTAGIGSYEILYIHPFVDYNGRTGRALAILILYLGGYDIRRLFSLEEHYDNDTEGYYGALQKVISFADDGKPKKNLTPWLEYFCEGLAIELTRVKEKVREISLDARLRTQAGKQVELSERQLKLVEFIQKKGYISSPMFREAMPEYSDDTVYRDLLELINKKVVKKTGKTKSARYLLKQGAE